LKGRLLFKSQKGSSAKDKNVIYPYPSSAHYKELTADGPFTSKPNMADSSPAFLVRNQFWNLLRQ
jgi:hypothetical protein